MGDHSEAFDWLHTGVRVHPGYGLLILETQQRIYEFLLPTIKEGDWYSLAAVAADAPYRLPAGLDLAPLEAIIDGKRSAAKDHLLVLRKDPAYFADVANEYKDYRKEVLLNINGEKHPIIIPYIRPLFWNRVLENVVADAYMELEIWNTLHSLVVNLRGLLLKFHHKISSEKPLSTELYEASVHFTFENGWAEREGEVNEYYINLTRSWDVFLRSFEGTSLGELGATEDGRFHYPVEKRWNRENVEIMRLVEEILDRFWHAVDAYTIQRTPEWVEPKKQSPAEIQFELVHRTEKTIALITQMPPKTKIKSRGESAKCANVINSELPAKTGDVQPVFKVDKRSFKVFSTLFLPTISKLSAWRAPLERFSPRDEQHRLCTGDALWICMTVHTEKS
ncbi:hypothetical protein TSTA_016060 [Talaromyces stipitatus ATCC 10500]|uniref:Uncharacterized protein n=1 Tax=Talaromyces stipitatus (strain ATCC 10500 / CBS 375.48 / QM 6759 / NRRL 1006) TaxID=441959 RepID=B8ME99_TALSN|nr:uncharacterized protein TSTA_016060 [Talaromyces stipitatus ATCC 10500]EED16526.1 hypothetical protein TSTA_016060 [Talaromyces stipitatus ATCC 10500]